MDRDEWWMPPQLVNAVNLPVQNALNFPAAILVKPFFDPNADAAFNYGAIGATIGHEISHSFDNSGALFDATGALRNWWTPADFKRFQQAGDALAEQYRRLRGAAGPARQRQADAGREYRRRRRPRGRLRRVQGVADGKPAPVIDGLTGDQRFFLAFAQSWATQDARPETLRQRIVDRRPRARAVPRADGAQPRRLVPGVQRAAGAEAVPARPTSA